MDDEMTKEAYEWQDRGYLTRDEAVSLPAEEVRKAVLKFMDNHPWVTVWLRIRNWAVGSGLIGALILGESIEPMRKAGTRLGIIEKRETTPKSILEKIDNLDIVEKKIDDIGYNLSAIEGRLERIQDMMWTKYDAYEAYNELEKQGVDGAIKAIEKVLRRKELKGE